MKNKAVFFDRDGVVNKRIFGDYVKSVEQFELIPEIPPIMKFLKDNSYLLILITNQQGVGKGMMSQLELDLVHQFMQDELSRFGVKFDDIFFCTEIAQNNSYRRKPNPGMILEAIDKYDIDPAKSYMIGDSGSDIIAGQRAGLKTILISKDLQNSNPDYYVSAHSELANMNEKLFGGDY